MAFFKDYGQRQLWKKLLWIREFVLPGSSIYCRANLWRRIGCCYEIEITAAGDLEVTQIQTSWFLPTWEIDWERGRGRSFLCYHDVTTGVEGRKYITLKKYFSLTAFVLHGRPGVMTIPILSLKPATGRQPNVWACFLVLQLLGQLWTACSSLCHTYFLQKTK